jgi:hypothetical protein
MVQTMLNREILPLLARGYTPRWGIAPFQGWGTLQKNHENLKILRIMVQTILKSGMQNLRIENDFLLNITPWLRIGSAVFQFGKWNYSQQTIQNDFE